MVKKAYPGTISSVILSVFVVMIMLVPLYTANHMDKVRRGGTTYEFREVMCFDISKKEHLRGDDYVPPSTYIPPENVHGSGACAYYYRSGTLQFVYTLRPTAIATSPLVEGTVGGYVVSDAYTHFPYTGAGQIEIYTTIVKEDILQGDITRIDVYCSIEGVSSEVVTGVLRARPNGYKTDLVTIKVVQLNLGSVNEVEITVDDLLLINTLSSIHEIYWVFSFSEELVDGAVIIYDMQFYHIEEIKITTIDYMGIAMVGGGTFMLFCSVLMLPGVTFDSVIGRIVGKGGK